MIASTGGVVHALLTHLWSVQGRADGTLRRLWCRGCAHGIRVVAREFPRTQTCGRSTPSPRHERCRPPMAEDNLWSRRLSVGSSSAVATCGPDYDQEWSPAPAGLRWWRSSSRLSARTR